MKAMEMDIFFLQNSTHEKDRVYSKASADVMQSLTILTR